MVRVTTLWQLCPLGRHHVQLASVSKQGVLMHSTSCVAASTSACACHRGHQRSCSRLGALWHNTAKHATPQAATNPPAVRQHRRTSGHCHRLATMANYYP